MNRPTDRRRLVAVGDPADPGCFSGTPHGLLTAGRRHGALPDAAPLPLDWYAGARRRWALGRLLRGRTPAGFQYSPAFLDRAERELPAGTLSGRILSVSQHFPRAASVREAGGSIDYYVDATAAQLTSGRGLDVRVPADVRACLLETERANYAAAGRVFTMSEWAARSVVEDCGADPAKVFAVLPGANLDLPSGFPDASSPSAPPPGAPHPGAAGIDRPAVLGFVGKDWARKGLPVLCDARDELARRGVPAVVRAAGYAPQALARREGVEFVGFLDKRVDPAAYPRFLAGCDLGCLFSEREALGLSVLEFLRAGVPVAGYAAEGPAETLPPDAGVRFAPGAPAERIADGLEAFFTDPNRPACTAAGPQNCRHR